MNSRAATFARACCLGVLAALAGAHPACATDDVLLESADVRALTRWIVASGDSAHLPFVIIDKIAATVFVFHPDGRLRGASPALLGLARGDDSVPGIGDRSLASIRPEERTTPAGRFVAAIGRNAHGQDVLWIDYEGAVSMHRVITGSPQDHRAQRLATPTPLDNRISYGCVNVPVKFYEGVVQPAFSGTNGIVYVLPETRSARAQFTAYDAYERARQLTQGALITR